MPVTVSEGKVPTPSNEAVAKQRQYEIELEHMKRANGNAHIHYGFSQRSGLGSLVNSQVLMPHCGGRLEPDLMRDAATCTGCGWQVTRMALEMARSEADVMNEHARHVHKHGALNHMRVPDPPGIRYIASDEIPSW